MRHTLTATLAILCLSLAAAAGRADTCPPVAPSAGTGPVTLCEHVLRLTCPARDRTFTGFRAEVDGEIGVITALHAVVDCPDGGIAEETTAYGYGLRLSRVDVARDAAFLSGSGLGEDALTLAGGLGPGRLRVVGYPLGAVGQSAIYLDLMHPRPWALHNMGLPEAVREALSRRQSPRLRTSVLSFVGELNRGHSGAPILSETGEVVAFGDGGLKAFGSDQVWAIPAWELEWPDAAATARAALSGQPTEGLAAFGSEAVLPSVPPLLFVDARDRAGPVYRHDGSGTRVGFLWGEGTIYSLATDGNGRVVFSNSNDSNIYEIVDGRARTIHTHHTYTRDVEFDRQGRLYFSEATGAGGPGRIFRLWRDDVDLQTTVALADVDGFWAGDFAFAPDNTIWLSSGNRVPANLYEVGGGGPTLRYSAPHPISGFAFLDADTIVYADWRQDVRTLHLPTMTEGEGVRLGTAEWLSDVALAAGMELSAAGSTRRAVATLVVLPGSPIGSIADVRAGMRLCGSPETAGRARSAAPRLGAAAFAALQASEAYPALTSGVCDGLLVDDVERLKAAFGRDGERLRAIEIR